jgi:D-sedoheptulose 7-phosphate isomerase
MGDQQQGIDQPPARVEITRQIESNIRLQEALKLHISEIMKIADVIALALKKGHKVLLMGNGGSAVDAQHIAGELAGKFYLDRDPLPAIALSANTCVITAVANDYSYEEIFRRQVRALAMPGDIVIGISTSGRSKNVVAAIQEARQRGAITVGFSGQGGDLQNLVDYALIIPSTDTPRIQELYLTAGHIICYLVERALFA